MQYVWQHRLWPATLSLATVDGRPVRIIHPGRLNTDAGPDFFNARILIGGRLWAGDVEIHVKASDWYRHGHHTDPAYSSVILHVVDFDDTAVTRPDGTPIDQMRLPCSPDFRAHYDTLVAAADRSLPCAGRIAAIEPIHLTAWTQALAYERLYERADRIARLHRTLSSDWESVSYVTLARALGFGINGDCFERLALATPLNVLGHHADNLLAVEALLFGQSGLLDAAASADPYVDTLRREYRFMAHKFGLRPMSAPAWKMARMRPAGFPHRRIALLASIIHSGARIHSRLIEAATPADVDTILSASLSGYWQHHYHLSDPYHEHTPQTLSRQSLATLAINVAATLKFAYGHIAGVPDQRRQAVELLESLPPETNRLTAPFTDAGLPCRDALTSQGLIQLRRAYCEAHRCLHCRIGHRHLSAHAIRQ